MQPVLTAAEIKACEKLTLDSGVPELVLMEKAALRVVEALEKRFGSLLPNTQGLVVAGQGNNGGDALAVARLLHEKKIPVSIYCPLKASRSASAEKQSQILSHLGVKPLPVLGKESYDWIIDGLFGTGLTRSLDEGAQKTIQWINSQTEKSWIVSIDIPSGLNADTGNPMPVSVRASETVTFQYAKRGLLTGEGVAHTGKLTVSDIGIAAPKNANTFLLDHRAAHEMLPKRNLTSHKGSFGHVYVQAGTLEMLGAAQLAALSAFRMGAGLVSIAGDKQTLAAIRTSVSPEILLADSKPSSPGVWVLGPGLGTNKEKWTLIEEALRSPNPLVLDADALNLTAAHAEAAALLCKRTAPTVLTPHPKEASRLLGTTVDEIQADRFAAIEKLRAKYGCTVLLKGKGTLIRETETWITSTGNSALAKGGSGDILAGMIASLLAQKAPAHQAAALGAYLHGLAGEIAGASFSEHGALPSDTIHSISAALLQVCG